MEQTYSQDQTMSIAQDILAMIAPFGDKATVLALRGDLGAGKTTLTKALAETLGITETVVSPTFVIAKFYQPHNSMFENVVHMDAYRIESLDELGPLGWEKIVRQPNTLIVVEWPEKISDVLPSGTHHFSISHEGEKRHIKKSIV